MGFELIKVAITKGTHNQMCASIDAQGQLTLSARAVELAGIDKAKRVQFYYDKRESLLGIATPDKESEYCTSLEGRKRRNTFKIAPLLQSCGVDIAKVKGRHPVRREDNHFLSLIIDLNQ